MVLGGILQSTCLSIRLCVRLSAGGGIKSHSMTVLLVQAAKRWNALSAKPCIRQETYLAWWYKNDYSFIN